jgi:hypothetical protein
MKDDGIRGTSSSPNKWMKFKYHIFHYITRALSIQKRSKFVKNEHVWYTLEYFSLDNARVFYTKGLNL